MSDKMQKMIFCFLSLIKTLKSLAPPQSSDRVFFPLLFLGYIQTLFIWRHRRYVHLKILKKILMKISGKNIEKFSPRKMSK